MTCIAGNGPPRFWRVGKLPFACLSSNRPPHSFDAQELHVCMSNCFHTEAALPQLQATIVRQVSTREQGLYALLASIIGAWCWHWRHFRVGTSRHSYVGLQPYEAPCGIFDVRRILQDRLFTTCTGLREVQQRA